MGKVQGLKRNKQLQQRELNFYTLFWIFFAGCFIGVIVETIWCLIRWHKFESRSGLIYGPFNLIYGFGALVITLLLYRMLKKNGFWIFLIGGAAGGAFEYFCSMVQEYLFGSVSWDYREYQNMPFVFEGRTSLLHAFFWGLLSVLWIKYLLPPLLRRIPKTPSLIGQIVIWGLAAFMVVNIVISGLAVARMEERQRNIAASGTIDKIMDAYYPDERLRGIYTNIKFLHPSS